MNIKGIITIVVAIIQLIQYFIGKNAAKRKRLNDLLDEFEGKAVVNGELEKFENDIKDDEKKLEQFMDGK